MNRLEVNIGAVVIAFSLYYIVLELQIIRNEMDLQTASVLEEVNKMGKLQKKVDELVKEIYAARITRELEKYSEYKETSHEPDKINDKLNLSAVSQTQTGLPSNAVLHPLTSPTAEAVILHCMDMKLDENSTNTNRIHINQKGQLINRPDPNKYLGRFQQYGSIRTSFPVASYGHPVYWEIKVKVTLAAPLQNDDVVMTTGLCVAETCDVMNNGFSLEYGSSLVMHRVENGIRTPLHHHPLANHAGSTGTFSYSIVLDSDRGKLGLLSLDEPYSWYSVDFNYTGGSLWPCLSVNTGEKLSVSVSLIVGREIQMTEHKKHLVRKALDNSA